MVKLANMSKYDTYKYSGIHELGDIPSHWTLKRFRNVFRFSRGLTITKEDLQEEGIPCINYGEIHSKFGFEVNPDFHPLLCVKPEYLNSNIDSLLRYGDFVFADTSEDIEGSGNFTYLNSNKEVFAGYHTVIARPKNSVNERFIAYVLESVSYRNQIRKKVKGVKVFSITQTILKPTSLWFPSDQEQIHIASFLDTKTSKLNEAIKIKKKQIDLLDERKKILIQQAVTQGINHDAPMKDTGVDCIGSIPEHWEVKRTKYLFNEIDERSENGDEEALSVSHITGVTPRSEKNVTMIAEDYSGSKTCQKNDFVMNIMWAWMGAMGVSDRPGIVSSAYSIFRQTPLNTFNPVYLEWLMKTVGYIEHYNKVSTGLHSSRLRFYSRMFFDMEIGYPSRQEQDEIVTHIEKQSFKIDEAVELQKQQIEKLKEYKTTLINSAVTGKIKVS
jgi:type I restriction enzyme S subunit